MSSENRQLPNSNVNRMAALDSGKAKNDNLGPASFITSATKTRLNAIQPTYRTKYDLIAVKKHDMVTKTTTKDAAAAFCKMTCSHFVQVFNFGIARDVFNVNDRTFYKIDVSSDMVPDMLTDQQVFEVSKDLIKGETDRVAAGGTAMAMPTLLDLQTASTALNNSMMPQSAAVDAYDAAQEDLDNQNTEADAVIKKVWDEVETFYNEETPASQRANAREWGVIYISVGSSKTISGTVRDSITNAPIEGVEIKLRNGNNTATSGADGSYELTTSLMGNQTLDATADLYNDYSNTVTLVENEDLSFDVLLVKMV